MTHCAKIGDEKAGEQFLHEFPENNAFRRGMQQCRVYENLVDFYATVSRQSVIQLILITTGD